MPALRDGIELQSTERENGIIPESRFRQCALFFPRVDGVKGYRDIAPRMDAAYDPFGNGRTALKLYLGEYLQGGLFERGRRLHDQQPRR